MKIINYDKIDDSFFKKIDIENLSCVDEIINDVRKNGDKALTELSKKFKDGDFKTSKDFLVSEDEIKKAYEKIDKNVLEALKIAIENVREFSIAQMNSIKEIELKKDISVLENEIESSKKKSEEEKEDTNNNDMVISETNEVVVDITSLTEEIMEQINHVENQYGIEIVTVEAKKLDLPENNKQAVYTRMISERENIAAQYTAEGKSQAQMIENTTDKEVSIMLSNAEAQAEATIAEGEAEYMKILSDAYSDPEKTDFYSFVRALDALKESMTGNNKTVILTEDSPIAQIFNGQY